MTLDKRQKATIVQGLSYAASKSSSRTMEYREYFAWFDSLGDDTLIGEYKDEYGEDDFNSRVGKVKE